MALSARLADAQRRLAAAGLAGLICRLPEHLVMLAGYWPVIARSALLLPAEGAPVLCAPAMEADALRRTSVEDVRLFPVWKLGDPPPEESLRRLLRDAVHSLGLRARPVGVEGSGDEEIAPPQKVVEAWRPAAASAALLQDLGCDLVDASPLLQRLRLCKTPDEVDRLRLSAEIAGFGIAAFRAALEEGRTEAEVAAAVEQAIHAQGTGYRGTVHARAQALVFSGTARLAAVGWGYAPSTARPLQRGDLVMLELCTVADGYYTDLTRMGVVGSPSPGQQEFLDAVALAQQAAIAAIRPGARAADVDRAARETLRGRGLEEHFIHITGHGLGFRYHEPAPLLHPGSTDELEEGMVTSVEPGVYHPAFGGVRIEDDVAVTAAGADVLSAGR